MPAGPTARSPAVAAGIALADRPALALPLGSALLAAIAAGASALIMMQLARRQIGGPDRRCARRRAEQVAETAILVLLAARLG